VQERNTKLAILFQESPLNGTDIEPMNLSDYKSANVKIEPLNEPVKGKLIFFNIRVLLFACNFEIIYAIANVRSEE
jgi:hypothetical protein